MLSTLLMFISAWYVVAGQLVVTVGSSNGWSVEVGRQFVK